MNNLENILNVDYLNCRGQSGFNTLKQLQIENFMKTHRLDILHLQECHIEDNTFSSCKFIMSNFNIIHNNSNNKYGTASLVKSSLPIEGVILHHSGRVIFFNIGEITFGNVYLPSGTDSVTRASRESYCGEVIPNLMINSKPHGLVGGDWNCITSPSDCTRHPEAKMSPCLRRMINTFTWSDTFRSMSPCTTHFSHFYGNARHGMGATRIDRSYSYGDIQTLDAKYISVAFSDHLSCFVQVELPGQLSTSIVPKSRPFYKIKPDIVKDRVFQSRLQDSMKEWESVKRFGIPTLTWWEVLVKPGVRKLALERGKELAREKKSLLNLLTLRQSYLTRKIQSGETSWLAALREVQLRIEDWFEEELDKIKYQSRVDDVQNSEKVRIFHHEIHQKNIKRSSILKLDTGSGLLHGHQACSDYLQGAIAQLLENYAQLDPAAQETLLEDIEVKFTEEDNKMMVATPTKAEVKESLKYSNLHASPGTDSLTSFFYKECFPIMGEALTEVAKAVFEGQKPTNSQRTSMMLYTTKPGKSGSLFPKDKRRLSMLNSDFKILTGIEVVRHSKVVTHTLCPQQLAAGDDRRISFGICQARDAVYAAGQRKEGCGLVDNDFEAAFDFLCLDWVRKVLEKKGLAAEALQRFMNLYSDGITIPIINNIPGRRISNRRLSLRQGDRPSGIWFCYGIDPLLVYLEKRLTGIIVHSLPVAGPAGQGQHGPLPPLEQRYKVQGYLDDCKPAITTMAEFYLVDRACKLFEQASGCKMHRDPASNKCKILALGRWKGTLQQEDIPLPYLRLTDHLDYLGVKLFANYPTTRRENGEILKQKIKDRIKNWKSGKFLPLTSRPWSINIYCLPKLWYRTGCVDLRIGDSDTISSSVKSWLFQDMLEKPQELVTYRPTEQGGLGVHNVKARAKAMLIHTFLSQAICPKFPSNQYHNSLYRWHVLEDRTIPDPGRPPYYSVEFFTTIKEVKESTPLNIAWVTVSQWYQLLLENNITHDCSDPNSPPRLLPNRLEIKNPGVDFPAPYSMSRSFGLSPEQKSFLFKLMQCLLPTRDRLERLGKVNSSDCTHCPGTTDSTTHLLECPKSFQVAVPLLACIRSYVPDIAIGDIVILNIPVQESLQLPISWLLSFCLDFIWKERVLGKQAKLEECRANLDSNLSVLKSTKWKHTTLHNSAVLLEDMINLHF